MLLGGAPGVTMPGIIALALARELGPAAIPLIAVLLLAAAAFVVVWSRRRQREGSLHS